MTLFTRSFLLIALLILASAAATYQFYRAYEREPRARELAQQTVSIVNLTRAALVNADPVLRRNLLIEMNEREGIRLALLTGSEMLQPLPDDALFDLVSTKIRSSLGAETRFAYARDKVEGFWVSFTIDDDDYWVMLPRERFEPSLGLEWLGGGLALLGLALAGAWLIASTLSRPLAAIAAAAREVGRGGAPAPLDESGPLELSTVSRAFNRMGGRSRIHGARARPKEGEQDAILLSDILRIKENLRWFILTAIGIVLIVLSFFNSENWAIYLILLIVSALVLFLKSKSFSKSFWYITALCVTFYSAMFPFQTFAIKFFQEAHGTSREVGGNLSSILTLAAMVFTPLFGLLADKIGKRSLLLMFGSLLIIPVYLMMAYQFGKPDVMTDSDFIHLSIKFFDIDAAIPIYLILPVAMMGIAFSLVPAVMWPSVAIIVDSSKLGTAYGLMTMIQNIGLFGFNLIIGYANDFSGASASNPGGYTSWYVDILDTWFSRFVVCILVKEIGDRP